MEIFFVRSWKSLAMRGLVGIAFGTVAFLWPSITLAGLVLLFGAYALIDGVLAISAATLQRQRDHVMTLALEGFVGVGVGLAAFFFTGATAIVLTQLIALWAILTGVLELALATRLRREMPGEVLLAIAGASSVVLGLLMFFRPSASAFVIVILLGCYAFFFGASMLAFALRLRRLSSQRDIFEHELRTKHGTP